jgi:F-type H+-transporting ATPase subunit delta
MASGTKQVQQLARQFFKLSIVDGKLAADRVAGVLEYIEKHRPAHTLAVLKAYQRLIAAEVARGQAVVEHAGSVNEATLASIAAAMTKKYSLWRAKTTRSSPVSASASATTRTNPPSPASSPHSRRPSKNFQHESRLALQPLPRFR